MELVERIKYLLEMLDLLWVLTLFVTGLLLIVAIRSTVEAYQLKKHLAERNEILKQKFNITEDLL